MRCLYINKAGEITCFFFTQVFLVVAFDVLSLDLLEDDCGLPSLMQLQSETKY